MPGHPIQLSFLATPLPEQHELSWRAVCWDKGTSACKYIGQLFHLYVALCGSPCCACPRATGQRDWQTDNGALTLNFHSWPPKGHEKCPICVFCKAISTTGNTDRIMLLFTRWVVWRSSDHQHFLPSPKSFFLCWLPLLSCHLQSGGLILLTSTLPDTNFYSDCIFFSCKFPKTTSDDKMPLYMWSLSIRY